MSSFTALPPVELEGKTAFVLVALVYELLQDQLEAEDNIPS